MNFGKLALAALFTLSASASHAQNIVANPGFETGLPPWTGTVTPGFFIVSDAVTARAHSGNRSGSFQGVTLPGNGSIQQTLGTVAGQSYLLDFWIRDENTSHPGGTDPVTLLWNGSLLATLDLAKDSTHHEYTFGVTATGATTVLQFGSPLAMSTGGSGIWRINIDDVSVTAAAPTDATPEPGSVALLVTSALTGASLVVRRRRKTRIAA